jgi:hypothetical protein
MVFIFFTQQKKRDDIVSISINKLVTTKKDYLW